MTSPIDRDLILQAPSDIQEPPSNPISTIARRELGQSSRQLVYSYQPIIASVTHQTGLQAHLQAWCDQKIGAPEHANRLTAKERIENCLREFSSNLDLSSLKLTSLPDLENFSFPELEEFDCSNNLLAELPDLSLVMPVLKGFNCSDNLLTALPNLNCVLSTLEWFDCSNNQLKTLSNLSRVMSALIWFDCARNQLTELPNLSLWMPKLTAFNCSQNQLTDLPVFSSPMADLIWFACSSNQLTDLPNLSLWMPVLKEFWCSNNLLTKLPEFNAIMPTLEKFYCSGNHLTTLSDFSLWMPALKKFDCSLNQLTDLPDFSSEMPVLEWFDCLNNQLTALPESILRWPKDCEIHAESNRFSAAYITSLQTSLLRIMDSNPGLGPQIHYSIYLTPALQAHLQAWCDEIGVPEHANRLIAKERIENCLRKSSSDLDLSSLQLTSLPDLENFSFPDLEKFECSWNSLRALPDFSQAMPALKWFSCSRNHLIELPKFGSIMPTLVWFNCSQNQLKKIPDFSSVIPVLKEFWCGENLLKTIPDLSLFPALEKFDCSLNQLEALPDFSSAMTTLKEFYCQENLLTELPETMLRWPSSCYIYTKENDYFYTRRNRFSPAYITKLQTSLVEIRSSEPTLGPTISCSPDEDALQSLLQKWCDQELGTPEHANRLTAKKRIEHCLRESSSRLDLSSLELTSLPEINHFYFPCEEFDCSHNHLTEISYFIPGMPNLKKLDCSGNCLIKFFEGSHKSLLKEINCSKNQLKTFSDFTYTHPFLEQFDCSDNCLEVLPEPINYTPNLKNFNCSSNSLTELHELMFKFPRSCTINAERNHFSPAYCKILETSLSRIMHSDSPLGPQIHFSIYDPPPRLAAGIPLDQTITFWLEAFKMTFPKTSYADLSSTLDEPELLGSTISENATSGSAAGSASSVAVDSFLSAYQVLLEHEKQEMLNLFLYKLTQTADYINPCSQNNVIFKVQRFLSGTLHSKAFRDHMFLLIDKALLSRDHPISFYLNEIEVQWKLDCEGLGLDPLKLARLIIGIKRMKFLDTQARLRIRDYCRQLETTQSLPLDQIETWIYCQVKLKEALKLPLSTEGMLYPAMIGVTDAMLAIIQKAVLDQITSKEDVCDLLCASDDWIQRLGKDHKAEFDKIITECTSKISALDPAMQGDARKAAVDQITEEQKGHQQSLVLSLTEDWLNSYFEELRLCIDDKFLYSCLTSANHESY